MKLRWSIYCPPHIRNRKQMEVLKQKSERMRHGHIYKKDNSGSQVENVLESEKNWWQEDYPNLLKAK